MRQTVGIFNQKALFIEMPSERASYGVFENRLARYGVLWALWDGSLYLNEVHDWAPFFKTSHGLYKAIRSIYSPSKRIVEFAKGHIWGGQLDAGAGEAGALPIVTTNEALRAPLAQLWVWSNWKVEKDIVPFLGSILGDVFIRVVDDVAGKKVYLEVLHPSIIEDVTKDAMGNVKAYVISYPATLDGRPVTFKEVCTRDRELVVFETFADNTPHAWNGVASKWAEPYGFVPMVHIQHTHVGGEWGTGELHAARGRIQEIDDVASVVTDRIRRMMRSGWLFAGYTPQAGGSTTIETPSRYASMSIVERRSNPHPIREEEPMLYTSDPQAKLYPMVAPADIAGAVGHINSILEDLEGDYPELALERLQRTGTLSGTALSKARQPAATKVNQLRAVYDDGLVRAQQMALSIGGLRGLFAGITLDSYRGGALQHSIGVRPVFAEDATERAENAKALWEAVKAAVDAGADLQAVLVYHGLSKEDAANISKSGMLNQ